MRPLGSVLAEAWATFDNVAVRGQVSFQQTDDGPTTITVALVAAPADTPLTMTVLRQATGAATAACPTSASVFDPARATATPCAGSANLASCAAGDLGGKFGPLPVPTGGTTVRAVYQDATLAVAGEQGIVGRTLRLAWAGGVLCASIGSSTVTATFFNGTTSLTDPSTGAATPRSVAGGVSIAPAVGGTGVVVAVTVRQGLAPFGAYSINIERTSVGTTTTGCPALADVYDPYEYAPPRLAPIPTYPFPTFKHTCTHTHTQTQTHTSTGIHTSND
jgi:hypothetical protein